MERKCKNSKLELDILEIDKERLLQKQHVVCIMLTTSADNCILSLIINNKEVNVSEVWTKFREVIYHILNWASGSHKGRASTVGGHHCGAVPLNSISTDKVQVNIPPDTWKAADHINHQIL